MRITDERGTYQGWYVSETGLFTQSTELASDVIKINADVIETLRLQGCQFIETVTVKDGHTEPYYIRLERFLELAVLEGRDLVYHV
jgi:hypothetical protein